MMDPLFLMYTVSYHYPIQYDILKNTNIKVLITENSHFKQNCEYQIHEGQEIALYLLNNY